MQFSLRPFRESDLDSLVSNANNWNIAKFMTNRFPHPYTEKDGKEFITFANQNDPITIFTIDIAGHASGAIGLHPQSDVMRKNAELGYWVAEPFWGKGIVSAAILQMVDYGFKNFDIHRIFARPFGNNKASQRVLEKTGFVLEAHIKRNIYKNGEYLDEMIYAVRRPMNDE